MPDVNYAAALPVLRKARERATGHGWVSLRNSFSIIAEHHDAYEMVRDAVQQQPIFSWLCGPPERRTQAEVLALFDRAIAECEEKTR